MKAYERVNVEVVKFEAQDVITASVATPVECTCTPRDWAIHKAYEGATSYMANEDHTRTANPAGSTANACYASSHPNCVSANDTIN